ncbi:hypothetical protein [Arsenicibacter rosenii]|uniref:hypothetical protein n=1 Tax=Arsenicibacter rosenii TaxID=1750698 RepID=UPI0015A65EB2|nr:hypothetical protein [Arsenicibacter rosenii]
MQTIIDDLANAFQAAAEMLLKLAVGFVLLTHLAMLLFVCGLFWLVVVLFLLFLLS